jgi:hypothetical protein
VGLCCWFSRILSWRYNIKQSIDSWDVASFCCLFILNFQNIWKLLSHLWPTTRPNLSKEEEVLSLYLSVIWLLDLMSDNGLTALCLIGTCTISFELLIWAHRKPLSSFVRKAGNWKNPGGWSVHYHPLLSPRHRLLWSLCIWEVCL